MIVFFTVDNGNFGERKWNNEHSIIPLQPPVLEHDMAAVQRTLKENLVIKSRRNNDNKAAVSVVAKKVNTSCGCFKISITKTNETKNKQTRCH